MKTLFNPYRSDGKLRTELRKAFLEDREIELSQKSIENADGSVFPLHIESGLREYLKANGTGKAIVSFQVSKTGEAIAIARLHRNR